MRVYAISLGLSVLLAAASVNAGGGIQPDGSGRYSTPLFKGTLQVSMLKINQSADPYHKLYPLNRDLPFSMHPEGMSSSDWTALINSGGEQTVPLVFMIDRYTPFRKSSTDEHRGRLSQRVDGVVKMVRRPEAKGSRYDKAGLYFTFPVLTIGDLRALVALYANPAEKKVWDLSTMDPSVKPALTLYIPPRSVTEGTIRSTKVTQHPAIRYREGWFQMPDPYNPCCKLWVWDKRKIGFDVVSDTTTTVTPTYSIDFPPFGNIKPENVGKLCARVEDATDANFKVERDLCVTFVPEYPKDFWVSCDSSSEKE